MLVCNPVKGLSSSGCPGTCTPFILGAINAAAFETGPLCSRTHRQVRMERQRQSLYGENCRAPPGLVCLCVCVCMCWVCLSSPMLSDAWLGQAQREAGLSQACQSAVTHHCGSFHMMGNSDRKIECCLETGTGKTGAEGQSNVVVQAK